MALHASISWANLLSREELLLLGGGLALPSVDGLLEVEVVVELASGALGVRPSDRACLSASISSFFSKKLFVDIPYDSNSFLISPARISSTFWLVVDQSLALRPNRGTDPTVKAEDRETSRAKTARRLDEAIIIAIALILNGMQ